MTSNFRPEIAQARGTGSSNHPTDAELSRDSANSQALSTRQSVSMLALSLARSDQQGIFLLLQ
jgi:flagellin